ncbi:MAG: cytochrome c oxidase subunit 3 [Flavobacteriaceae bacterium]|nr:cytochrome c oxidase subunit 3 [Flavobacteriaceae bacterium]
MNNTLKEELLVAKRKSAKPMLWFSLVSMTMMFAGLTSAYVVSSRRDDWVSFDLPPSFFYSSLLILLSSITFYLAVRFTKKDHVKATSQMLLLTLALGLGFGFFQFQGFQELYFQGHVFAGAESTVKSSFLYGITGLHFLHAIAGLIVLLIVIYNNFKGRYSSSNSLGLELGAIFWHFVDLLWIYLFFFFYFNR